MKNEYCDLFHYSVLNKVTEQVYQICPPEKRGHIGRSVDQVVSNSISFVLKVANLGTVVRSHGQRSRSIC